MSEVNPIRFLRLPEVMSQVSNASVRLLRLPAVMEMTGLGRSTVYQLVREKKFPEPVHVVVPKMTVWPSDKIEQWVQDQLSEGRGA